MKKIKWIFLTIMLLLQINVKASNVTVNVDCDKLKLDKGGVTTCELLVTTSDIISVNNVSINIEKDSDLTLSLVTKNGFDGSFNNDRIVLNSDNLKKGSFSLGTLTVTVSSTASYGDKLLTFKDIQFSNTENLSGLYTANNVSKSISVLSDENTLANIAVDGVEINNFDSSKLEYNINVDSENIVVFAEATSELATVSGTGEHKLDYGKNTIEIKVTSQKGNDKIYKLIVNRSDNRSSVNTLKSLMVEGIKFNFKSTTNVYKINVASSVDKIKINSELTDDKASYVEDYGNREVELDYGENEILVKVLSENEKENIYTLKINREDNRSEEAKLTNLVINGTSILLRDNIYEYDVKLYYKHEKTDVQARSNKLSNIEYQNINLKVGINVLIIKVISEKGTVQEYKINIERLSQEDSKIAIKNILIDGYNLNFTKNVYEYNLKIDKNIDSLNIEVLPIEEEIVYTVLGNGNLRNGSKITVNVKDDFGDYVYTINIIKDVEEELILGFLTIEQICYIVFVVGLISFLCSIIFAIKNKNIEVK